MNAFLLTHLATDTHAAVNILAEWGAEEDTRPLEQSLACIERCMQGLAIKFQTPLLISHLQSANVDYTLLMYLQADEGITKGRAFVSYLKGVCEQFGVPWRSRLFLDTVWAHFKRQGVKPITPSKYIAARTKTDILAEYQRVLASNEWRQHNPFFFQTFITKDKGYEKLVFFITRTWQDGAIRLLEILKEGSFPLGTQTFEAHGVFEHFVDDDSLVGLILDSEIMSSAFKDGTSVQHITAELLRFPGIVAHDLVTHGLLHEESMLPVTVKDKTRMRGDATKVSFHFLLHICALKAQQRTVVELLTQDHKKEIERGLTHLKANKTLPEDCKLPIAWYAFDEKACKSNGFNVPGSRKTRTDPHSRKYSDRHYCLGQLVHEELCPIAVQDLQSPSLTDAERLWLLQEQLYTTPKPVMLSYAIDFGAVNKVCPMRLLSIDSAIGIRTHAPLPDGVRWQEKNGGKPTCPQPGTASARSEGGGRVSSAQSNLPAWLLSALRRVTGRDVEVYLSPSSLESKRSTLPKASQPNARLYQIPSSWCANSMTQGTVHIHNSNCTVVAVDDALKVVYMTCVTGAPGHRIVDNSSGAVKVVNMFSALGEDGRVQPVTEVRGRCIHWVMLDEEDMALLIEKG